MSAARVKAKPAKRSRTDDVVDVLKAAQGQSKRFAGLKSSEVAIAASINSSSQACSLLRKLVKEGLVVKTDEGKYKLA